MSGSVIRSRKCAIVILALLFFGIIGLFASKNTHVTNFLQKNTTVETHSPPPSTRSEKYYQEQFDSQTDARHFFARGFNDTDRHRARHSPKYSCPNLDVYLHWDHPMIAITTMNRPHLLNITLYQLICVAGANRNNIIVVSDTDNFDEWKESKIIVEEGYDVDFQDFRHDIKYDTKQQRLSVMMRQIFSFAFDLDYLYNGFVAGLKPGYSFPKRSPVDQFVPSEFLVVLEDDLVVSADFVPYFHHMSKMMKLDPSIFCVSAWNDNSYPATSNDVAAFRRGEHFMALGWMFSRDNYNRIIRPGWRNDDTQDPIKGASTNPPLNVRYTGYRNPAHADEEWDGVFVASFDVPYEKRLECVYPEVPRVHHNFEEGRKTYSVTGWLQSNRLDTMSLAFPTKPKSELVHAYNHQSAPKSYGLPKREMTMFPYDRILHDNYENWLESIAKSSIRLKNLEDARFFKNKNLTFYCEQCVYDNRTAWNDIMDNMFHLIGAGIIDYRPRGVHRNSVLLRFATNLLLIMGVDSPYLSHVQSPVAHISTIEKSSAIHGWRNNIFIGSRHDGSGKETCHSVCADHKLKCNDQYMAAINDCEVLTMALGKDVCPNCVLGHSRYAPFITNSERPELRKCESSMNRFISCDTPSNLGDHRICYCS